MGEKEKDQNVNKEISKSEGASGPRYHVIKKAHKMPDDVVVSPSPIYVAAIIAGILLLLTLISILWILISQGRSPDVSKAALTVRIWQDGAVVQEIPLRDVKEPMDITFSTRNGGYNIVHITPEGASVVAASCPDHICVKAGAIHNSALPIVCLPNKLIVTIAEERESDSSEVDAITY